VTGDVGRVLSDRASRAGIALPDSLSAPLIAYFELLSRWNRTINLTSLADPAEAVDRLLLEPVLASAHLPHREVLVDLGSGGGSPAVPLALATGATRLVMVESRVRKAAFLREVQRELGLAGSIEAIRFEDMSMKEGFKGMFGLLSVRAVRLDRPLFEAAKSLLRTGGTAALFGSREVIDADLPPSLTRSSTQPLVGSSALTILQRS
jgi:16S rRNA (guanine527-N7)-methyltransferase